MQQHILKGLITGGRSDEWMYIGDTKVIEYFEENFQGETVSVRYWISDKELPIDQLKESFLHSLFGATEVKNDVWYTEVTGFISNIEEAIIGGHDLIEELCEHAYHSEDRYIYMEVDVH